MSNKNWNLVADIGGTNARFGLVDFDTSSLEEVRRYSVAEFPNFDNALKQFLLDIGELGKWRSVPQASCLAIACPADADEVQFTNSPWSISRQMISSLLGGAHVEFINDFAAVGYAVAELKPQDWKQIGGKAPIPGKAISILGPGTGLGVSTLVPVGTGYHLVEGEGGHVDFAPIDQHECAVLEILTARYGRVSIERLLSGAGILNLYQSLAQLSGKPPQHESPAQITEAALKGNDSLAERTLHLFCRILGSHAGNLALTLGAKGGVYVAGGIVPRFIDFFQKSDFRQRFEAKGRFRPYLVDIPVRVVLKDNLGLFGAARKLQLME